MELTYTMKRIRELLDLGRYMPQSLIDKAADYEYEQVALNLLYITNDFSDRNAPYNQVIQGVIDQRGGYSRYNGTWNVTNKSADSSNMKASDVMNNLLPFIAGYICGGAAGVFFMCLFQINRNERKDDEQ